MPSTWPRGFRDCPAACRWQSRKSAEVERAAVVHLNWSERNGEEVFMTLIVDIRKSKIPVDVSEGS